MTGILRAYYSLASMHGWALVPPQQHGGFATMRMTQLWFDQATMRAVLTAPPRSIRGGRYLYVGGRRRRVPEPWMLA